MAVVKEFNIGNTHIRIHDDSCVKTSAEVEEILRRCGDIWYHSDLHKLERGEPID